MKTDNRLILLDPAEYALRLDRLRRAMAPDADAMLLTDNADLYWLTGRVFDGWAYIPASGPADSVRYGLRRSAGLHGPGASHQHKIETFAEALAADPAVGAPARLALELDALSYNSAERIRLAFLAHWPAMTVTGASAALRAVRAVKTDVQLAMMRASGIHQEAVYRRVPSLYTEGMTDYELQVEIERASRLEGCLGQFRTAGADMELFMGNVLTGDNADTPSPYDFAMGGAGMDPRCP